MTNDFTDRRNFLLASTLLLTPTLTGLGMDSQKKATPQQDKNTSKATTTTDQSKKEDHQHHHDNRNQEIIAVTLECIKNGQACVAHCVDLIKSGDTSMSVCLESSQSMLAFAIAFSQLASSNSVHIKKLTDLAISICQDCEKDCRVHANKHEVCKQCAESCKNSIDAYKKFLAS